MIWIWIALGISLLYCFLIFYYLYGWYKTPMSFIPVEPKVREGVTIVVIAHNEEKMISDCLRGLLRQNFPLHLVEIIVVDDHSTDATGTEIKKIEDDRVRMLLLKDYPGFIHPPAFKKSGITLAVDQARYETIVLTDADVRHPPNWLQSVLYPFHERDAVFQTAPVLLTKGNTMLEIMQETEQLVLMLITGAGLYTRLHDMANGANMAFRKKAFMDVKGYEGNYAYASGDDMFLIEKMRKKFPDQISFVKSIQAAVFSTGKKDWSSLLQQRLRWAGKNKGLENKTIQVIWYFIGLFHFMIIGMIFLALFHQASWWPVLVMIMMKFAADCSVVVFASAFFQRKTILKYFIPLQALYGLYVIRLAWVMIHGKKGNWRNEA